MPTGYTAAVMDGKVTGLREFMLNLARAGEHDPPKTPINERKPDLAPSQYVADRVARARAEVARYEAMDPEEAIDEQRREQAERSARYAEADAERKITAARYDAMLAKVRAWDPPTEGHEWLKGFAIKQLEESKDNDARPPRREYYFLPPVPPEEWIESRYLAAKEELELANERLDEDIEGRRQRLDWINALERSL